MYGTTDWFIVQFLSKSELENTYTSFTTIRLLICMFVFSIFFKLGVTPFHLFKIEIYKGIPYLSIFFYTTYYFIVLFLFLLFLLSDYLSIFIPHYYLFSIIILFVGFIYVIILLFDVNFLKAFFAYSTIINTVGFLTVFISDL